MNKVVFLDRDGTINVDHGYVHEVDRWEFVPGAIEGMKQLQAAGFTLTIITNQSGIGQGLYTLEQMEEVHRHMYEELESQGVEIAALAYCPHARDGEPCACRKPETGMADIIEETVGPIDYSASWAIGDKEADVGFGKKLDTQTILIRSKYWDEESLRVRPDFVAESLLEAAGTLLDHK